MSETLSQSSDYFRPYCPRCQQYVLPQVVGTSRIFGAMTIDAPGPINPTVVGSHTEYRKFCSICGEQVFSQANLDDVARAKHATRERTILLLGWSSLLLGPLTGILACVMAATHKPLTTRIKIAVGVAFVMSVFSLIRLAIFGLQ